MFAEGMLRPAPPRNPLRHPAGRIRKLLSEEHSSSNDSRGSSALSK